MPFIIQGQDVAAVPDTQSPWYETDIAILVAGIAGTGVLTGCEVTAQGSPDMTVAVDPGSIQPSAGAASVTVTGDDVAIDTADSEPRIDLVTADPAGVLTYTAGGSAPIVSGVSGPKPPALPAGHVALAMVDVPAAVTAITTARITDKRVMVFAASSGGSSFSPPGGVANPYAWYKADAITGLTDGSAVPLWANSVPGIGLDLCASGSPVYKTGIVNGLPVVRLAGSETFLTWLGAVASANQTFVLVFKLASIAAAYTAVWGQNSVSLYGIKSNGKSAEYYNGISYDGSGAATFDTTSWNYVTVVNDAAAGKTRRNGVDDMTAPAWGTAGYPGAIMFGGQIGQSRNMAGDIAEILVYGRTLTATEITAIESYLATKYAL